MQSDLFSALDSLEEELGVSRPHGSGSLPPKLRYLRLLHEIRSRLCPHKEAIYLRVESDTATLIVATTDAVVAAVTATPIVAATLAKYLTKVGLRRFCDDPTNLIEEQLDD